MFSQPKYPPFGGTSGGNVLSRAERTQRVSLIQAADTGIDSFVTMSESHPEENDEFPWQDDRNFQDSLLRGTWFDVTPLHLLRYRRRYDSMLLFKVLLLRDFLKVRFEYGAVIDIDFLGINLHNISQFPYNRYNMRSGSPFNISQVNFIPPI